MAGDGDVLDVLKSKGADDSTGLRKQPIFGDTTTSFPGK